MDWTLVRSERGLRYYRATALLETDGGTPTTGYYRIQRTHFPSARTSQWIVQVRTHGIYSHMSTTVGTFTTLRAAREAALLHSQERN
jgi:hypothetical protein